MPRLEYLRIRDLGPHSDEDGAWVDAIALHKVDGSVSYVERVIEYESSYLSDDPTAALGPPDSSTQAGADECNRSMQASVPLGGVDGEIIVLLEAPVAPGDTLIVHRPEGPCEIDAAGRNTIELAVSSSSERDDLNWQLIASAEGEELCAPYAP